MLIVKKLPYRLQDQQVEILLDDLNRGVLN